jgi:acetolactate synthase-1/3 small subunit
MSTHTISLYVENHSGALSRIAGLFSSRGYNISSLTVAETEDESVSRMTIVVSGEEGILEQVVKQLNRLVDVIKVMDFVNEQIVDREVAVIRLDTAKASRHDIWALVNAFEARIAGVSPTSVTIELTGTNERVNDFIGLVKPYGIRELVRSGKIAMAKARK